MVLGQEWQPLAGEMLLEEDEQKGEKDYQLR